MSESVIPMLENFVSCLVISFSIKESTLCLFLFSELWKRRLEISQMINTRADIAKYWSDD